MHMISATAVAKLIIAGEHAVVYRRPALAVPLPDITARVQITAASPHQGCSLHSPDLHTTSQLGNDDDPLLHLIADVLHQWQVAIPDIDIRVTSDIPIASGMGSGAAVATALVRALSAWFERPLTHDTLGDLVFRSEQRLHGNPSGIDNTVIAYDRPIYFCRQAPAADGTAQSPLIQPLTIAAPLTLVVGDTGQRSPTHAAVSGVRQRREHATAQYDACFDAIAATTLAVHQALANGDVALVGTLCRANHTLLQQIGVSSPALDTLVAAAMAAGAYGAKLSGAGVGGVMFAVVSPAQAPAVCQAIQSAGAVRAFVTTVNPHHP
jgi:mevalonate kinase